jgi:hypothetical protein
MNKSKIFYFVTAIPILVLDVIILAMILMAQPATPVNILIVIGGLLFFEVPLILFVVHIIAMKKLKLTGSNATIINIVFGLVNLFYWLMLIPFLLLPVMMI